MRYVGSDITIFVNKHNLSYTDEGPDHAPVIILIHGFPLNKSMWISQVEVLIENFRVIAYDIRGHGNSEAGEDEFSIGLFVDDLLDLMNALKIEKAMLCGLSMGGYIAIQAIENFPNRFEALILCDTNCMTDTPDKIEKRMKTIESIGESGLEHYAEVSLKSLFAPESFVTSKEKIALVREMIMKTSVQSLTRTLIALTQRKETCTKLADIKVPVLIMVGKEDILTSPEAAILMQKKVKGSTLNIIEHAGHLSNIENSYEFNFQLVKFVSSVNQHTDKGTNRDQLGSEVKNSENLTRYKNAENDLNSKILKITLRIKDHYPELSKYLDEMPGTVPSENDPEITLKHLQTYFESLNSLLNKYKEDYPKIEE